MRNLYLLLFFSVVSSLRKKQIKDWGKPLKKAPGPRTAFMKPLSPPQRQLNSRMQFRNIKQSRRNAHQPYILTRKIKGQPPVCIVIQIFSSEQAISMVNEFVVCHVRTLVNHQPEESLFKDRSPLLYKKAYLSHKHSNFFTKSFFLCLSG